MSTSKLQSVSLDAYSFTTTPDDFYIERVLGEAKHNVNFIIVHDNDTRLPEFKGAILLVRVSVLGLAEKFPDLKLAGKTLYELQDIAMDNPDEWFPCVFVGTGELLEKKLETVRQQIRAINNKIHGRIIKVIVESF
jgi:hypothetical protein